MKPIDNRMEIQYFLTQTLAPYIEDWETASLCDYEDALDEIYGYCNDNRTYDISNGVEKFCLVPKDSNRMWVLKWAKNDACNKEYELYQLAIRRGIQQFFPETIKCGSFYNKTFYLQRCIDCSVYELNFNVEDSYRKKAKTSYYATSKIWRRMEKAFDKADKGYGYNRGLNRVWASMALVIYGKKACKELCNFLYDYTINDLHDSNIGYLNNKPIILDFCGFHEESW